MSPDGNTRSGRRLYGRPWQAPRPGGKVGRERGTTVMTVTDCVEMGIAAAASAR